MSRSLTYPCDVWLMCLAMWTVVSVGTRIYIMLSYLTILIYKSQVTWEGRGNVTILVYLYLR